ncbi:ATP-binding protein [Pseudonocardia sp. TRM90224]|uniref:preATP grasp domain-containing protein n=1 Tax=Pseudonocardia sp. TRM90224 TaxID=2812678 RepID=UPI001E2BC507|nr:ATP-grasp domain-containing protein [Pseudonocardia sp. TRM90224]
MTTTYLRDLKKRVTGDSDTPLVLLCNLEVETHWATGFVGLPAPPVSPTAAIVSRMEELGLLLAGPDDHLLVQQPVDAGYLAYVKALGFGLPTVLVADRGAAGAPTADRAAATPAVLARLQELARDGARLLPMGLARPERQLARATGLVPATPPLDVVTRVNSKIYGRRLAEAAGLRTVPGWCCETVEEFTALMTRIGPDCSPTSALVVKDAYGVSGKGLLVVDRPQLAERIVRQVTRRAGRTGDTRLHVVVERWLPRRADLNYQLTVDVDGAVHLDFVKEALTADGVHIGHVSPPELTAQQHTEITSAAQAIGAALHADGYVGIAGVDAIVTTAGELHPLLEINARFNMSTYQGGVLETLAGELPAALAGRHVLRLDAPLAFADVQVALGPLLGIDPTAGGLVITCFGTVNALAGAGTPFEGRLFTLAVGPDRAAVAHIRLEAAARLSRWTRKGA